MTIEVIETNFFFDLNFPGFVLLKSFKGLTQNKTIKQNNNKQKQQQQQKIK